VPRRDRPRHLHADKLHGAPPGVKRLSGSTKFERVINLKTAKAMGLTVPPSLLRRADQLIE
jgi:ABC-type uncharacterized transport system, periplasmic component